MTKSVLDIHIVTSALPPQLDGIGDYSSRVATALAELPERARVTVLTTQEQEHDPIPNVTIRPVFNLARPQSVSRLIKCIEEEEPDWILLQYNPFSFGRWGLNPYLPLVMRAIKRRHQRTRFALMVHEPFVPITGWKFAIMTIWQRWQLRQLGRHADVVFFSIDPWVRKFQSWFPKKDLRHLPVFSNIPFVSIEREEARRRLQIEEDVVVLGVFGTLHSSRMLHWVHAAAEAVCQAGHDTLVLYMGPHGQAAREILGSLRTITDGPLPADEISRRFQAVDIYLSPFIDGISTRRGSLMTALQHGVPTVGTDGSLTDAMLRKENGNALLLADVNAPDEFTRQVLRLVEHKQLREQLGREAQELYERDFSCGQCAARILSAMNQSY